VIFNWVFFSFIQVEKVALLFSVAVLAALTGCGVEELRIPHHGRVQSKKIRV
jgi:hypothetical protein